MLLGDVVGRATSTVKHRSMVGYKLLVVEPFRVEAKQRKSLATTGRTFIAVDMLGAGEGDYVLITQGSSARMTPETKQLPIDTVVVGIIDNVQLDTGSVYSREA